MTHSRTGAPAGAAGNCYGGGTAPYPIGGVTYAEGQASEVQLSASITVTYEIQ